MSCVASYGWYAVVGFMAEVVGLDTTAGGALGNGGRSSEELGAMPEIACNICSSGVTAVANSVARESAICPVLMGRIALLPCSVL